MKKLGLIAGNGRFPLIFAAEAKRAGYTVVAVAHHHETLREIADVVDQVNWIYVGQLGKIIQTFRDAGVTEAVMAGGIKKIKWLGNFRPDWRGARFLARMKKRDDDALLRGIADELAGDGIAIMESTLCLSHLIAKTGVLTDRAPSSDEWRDIHLGVKVAKEIGKLGIGQTVVIRKQMILAVEAVEGTDAAIRRGGSLGQTGSVVVKVSKPSQDLRFDVPAVGVQTISSMRESHAVVLAVEAGKTLLLEKEVLLDDANRWGMSVVAVNEQDGLNDA